MFLIQLFNLKQCTEFYKIIANEESTKDLLQAGGLLPDSNSLPPFTKCGGETKEYNRKKRSTTRAVKEISVFFILPI